uniref:(northern house mosquito) hypothetical protein n=1 Tax=Culex pipiens TaxID=7175 RepID=A0A8D8JHC7_CULPI
MRAVSARRRGNPFASTCDRSSCMLIVSSSSCLPLSVANGSIQLHSMPSCVLSTSGEQGSIFPTCCGARSRSHSYRSSPPSSGTKSSRLVDSTGKVSKPPVNVKLDMHQSKNISCRDTIICEKSSFCC